MSNLQICKHNPLGLPEVTFSREQAIEMLSWLGHDPERLLALGDRCLTQTFRGAFKPFAAAATEKEIALRTNSNSCDDAVLESGRVFMVPTFVEVADGFPAVDLTSLFFGEYAAANHSLVRVSA